MSSFVDGLLRLAGGEQLGLNLDLVGEVYGLLGEADAPLEPSDARRIGELATRVAPAGIRMAAKYLPGSDWPARLRVLVVNAASGELRILGPSDDLPLEVGVAASCAAPGVAPPIVFPDGGLYVERGARSAPHRRCCHPRWARIRRAARES